MRTFRQPFKGEWPVTQAYAESIPGVTVGTEHTGIDYGCPNGTEILASSEGEVMFAGWDPTGYGLCVIIRHSSDRSTLYAHLSKIHISRGDKVRQGQPIGLSGSSGYATGPHLHFEARYRWDDYKSHFDPMALPLMSFADAAENAATQPEPKSEQLPAGIYKVACEYAFIRTWDSLQRDRILNKGERIYIFGDCKINDNGLPFRFIGAGRCIAEYDSDGTIILEKAE